MTNVKLISITPNAENIMAYCARVSSDNQTNPNIEKLLTYCITHKHWSVFEMADMCVEITTSRAIAAQILRHRSFHFQEFSQRYAEVEDDAFCIVGARGQDLKNRQNSLDNLSDEVKIEWDHVQKYIWAMSKAGYDWAINNSVAKECARMVLPLSTTTKLYMKGTVRDWIHYINLRTGNGTQLEHKEIADKIKDIFLENMPIVGIAAFN